ncbi:MAG: SPOR domain-containing protein [Muribaculaceae bacterium]|nr:SPOR domain-containing protein [Muribaculaceae bacterium]
MISLTQHIEYLMMRHDCVVIPGWGALVASHSPSNSDQSSISRPTRLIGFNPSIAHNDGLLATSVARRHNISYTEACKVIADNVSAFRRQLATGSELPFGRLGFFKKDDNSKLLFTPTFHNEASDEFFGLHNLEFPTLSSLSQTSDEKGQVAPNIFGRRGWRTAAAIAALIGIGALLSTPVVVDKSIDTASLNIANVKTAPTAVTVKPTAQATKVDNQIAVIDTPTVKSAEPSEQTFNEGMPSDENGAYFLVINSCKKQHQAQALAKQYANKGIKCKTIARGGYYHVVVAQSNNQKELINAKKLLPEKYRKAWVCK